MTRKLLYQDDNIVIGADIRGIAERYFNNKVIEKMTRKLLY